MNTYKGVEFSEYRHFNTLNTSEADFKNLKIFSYADARK